MNDQQQTTLPGFAADDCLFADPAFAAELLGRPIEETSFGDEQIQFTMMEAQKQSATSGAQGSTPGSSSQDRYTETESKERTRMAHRRFRLRKKEKVANLHKEVEDMQQQLSILAAQNHHLQLKNKVLNDLLQCLDDYAAFVAQINQCNSDTVAAALHPLGPLVRECQVSSVDNLLHGRQLYITAASNLLLEAESSPNGAAMHSLRDLNHSWQLRCKVLTALETSALYQAMVEAMGVAAAARMPDAMLAHDPDVTDHQHWVGVVTSLNLTQDQKLTSLIARELLITSIQQITSERQTLGALAASLVPRRPVELTSLQPSDSELHAGSSVLDRLRRNLSRHRNTNMLMFVFLLEHVLDPLQYAKLWVHSFPQLPLVLSLLNVLAAETVAGRQRSG